MLRNLRVVATSIMSIIILLSMVGATLPPQISLASSESVTPANWSAKELVASGSDLPFPTPLDIAVDGAGNAYVLWWDRGVYFSYRPFSGGWSAPEVVNDAPYQGGGSSATLKVSIAIDQSGIVYAMWVDYRNSDFGTAYYRPDIAFSYRPVGGSWQPNIIVNEVAGNAILPDIAVDASGNAYAVWTDYRNDPYSIGCLNCNTDIYFSYRPAGGNWGTNIRVNDNDDLYGGTQYQYDPAIAVDQLGNAYSVWQDTRNTDIFSASDIYFSFRPNGGTWEANLKVSDDANGSIDPAIAVDANSNAYALWVSSNNGWDIGFSYRPAGGNWGASVRVNDDEGVESQYSPAISVDQSGNANAIWFDYRNGGIYSDIYTSYRPVAGSWGTNINITADTENSFDVGPAIATDASGRAYAVWSDVTSQLHNDIYFAYQQDVVPPPSCEPNDLHPYQWDMTAIKLVGALSQFPNCLPPPVKVAVIDTGVDSDHPDLQANIDFTGTIVGRSVEDKIGHGTTNAGIIGAVTNNGIGVAGVDPTSQLIIYKYTDTGTSGADGANNLARLIKASVILGAKVINVSIGARTDYPIGSRLPCVDPLSCNGVIKDAVQYAYDNSVIIVAASGNKVDKIGPRLLNKLAGTITYPAGYSQLYPNVIAVAATKADDTLAEYSFTGDFVTIAAPGGAKSIVNRKEVCAAEVNDCIFGLGLNGSYTEDERVGTSYAAPHVTGVVALVIAANPTLNPLQIRFIIRDTATPFAIAPSSPAGSGIVNAEKAVERALSTIP